MDMIRAIDDAGSLDLVLQNFGWGLFVDGIIYNGYSRIGYDGGENWWHYWVSPDGDNWTSPWDYGASGRILSNGDWDGWGYGFASAPDIPLVPEPSSLLAILSLVGAGVSIKKKR
jgi:PEP-CTERM putative exosortase interaction domain